MYKIYHALTVIGDYNEINDVALKRIIENNKIIDKTIKHK